MDAYPALHHHLSEPCGAYCGKRHIMVHMEHTPPPPDIPVDPHISDHSDLNTAMLTLCSIPQCKARNVNQTTRRKLHFLLVCTVLYMYMQYSCIRYGSLHACTLCVNNVHVHANCFTMQCFTQYSKFSHHYQYMHTHKY